MSKCDGTNLECSEDVELDLGLTESGGSVLLIGRATRERSASNVEIEQSRVDME